MNKPWEQEEDFYEWTDEETGFHCVIGRNSNLKVLCGYVGIPKSHPYYLKTTIYKLKVHGDVTFEELRLPPYIRSHSQKGFKYIGFDCGHAYDFIPGLSTLSTNGLFLIQRHAYEKSEGEINPEEFSYKDVNFVKKEIKKINSSVKTGAR